MRKYCVVVYVFFLSLLPLCAQDAMTSGLDAYARSDWSSAILSFQRALSDSSVDQYEPAFWIIMAHASAKNYGDALSEAEAFLKKYPNNPRTAEVLYQQGRMYCLSAQHDTSITALYDFITSWPNHLLVPSAYYWIGENLYMVGRFSEARVIFSKIILDYSYSAKVEASRYKISLIDQASTQEELLKLLKTSHEETLRLVEEAQSREKMYEQTVAAYQKRLSDMKTDTRAAELEELLKEERRKNAELYDRLTMLEMEYDEKNIPPIINNDDYAEREKRRLVLEALREKARILESMYDNLLEEEK